MEMSETTDRNQITKANQPFSEVKSEFAQWTTELEQLAQAGVKEEITQHKAADRPIFYSRQGVPIMEITDGRCFEYRHLEDGTREIIREVPPQ